MDLRYWIPLVMHGDDADAHRRRSFSVVTISSALTSGSPWDTKMVVYALDNSRACAETYDTLNAWVIWSLTELQEGRRMSVDPFQHPIKRKQGSDAPIAGKYRGVVVQIKGDEKWIQKALHLVPSSVSPNWVCPLCRASRHGSMIYTSYGPSAPHRGSHLSTPEFIQEACRPGPIVRLPGFAVDLVTYDWLHLVDLSIVPECAASVTWMNIVIAAVSLPRL